MSAEDTGVGPVIEDVMGVFWEFLGQLRNNRMVSPHNIQQTAGALTVAYYLEQLVRHTRER